MNDAPTSSIDHLLDLLLTSQTHASQPLDANRVLLALAVTFCISLIIVVVYRLCRRHTVLRTSHALSLILVALVTTVVIMPLSTSIVLSLGMVGALSIVRFRTAMKDPMDIAFLFWAIAIGVCNGAGFYQVSTTGSLAIGALMVVISQIPLPTRDPMLLIVRYAPAVKESVEAKLPKGKMLSKMGRGDQVELTLEVLGRIPANLTEELTQIEGVHEASLVRFDGSYATP